MQTRRVKPLLLGMALLAVPVVLTLSPGGPLDAAAGGDSPTANLHKAVAEEKYAEAKRQADALLRSPNQQDRVAASLCYGRILLSLGLKDQARQYLATMGRLNLDANAARLMKVYQAWLAAIDGKPDGKPDEAIKTLEQMLVDKQPGSATAEAADVLAILYLKRGDKDNAKKAVDFGLGFIKYENAQGGKIPGYIEALLKGRLKVDTGDAFPEAKKLYEQAEKLRKEGKFTEAGKLYVQVRSGWPRSLWSHASGFRIGQCLVGLGRLQQAEGHWQAFATDSPPGPWRGQARVGLIDLVLAAPLDLKTAARHAAAAQKILETAACRIIPSELTIGGDEKLPLALSLGTIYNLVGRFEQASRMFDLVLSGSARKPFKPHRSFAALGEARALVGEAKKRTVPLPETPNPTAAASGGLSPFSPASSPLPSAGEGLGVRAASLLNAAKALYTLSLNEKPDAAWHQETLRELALLIEELAEHNAAALTSKLPSPVRGRGVGGEGGRKQQRVLSREQVRAALEAARSEALPYWVKLTTQFPKSPHLPEALYHAGVLFSEGAKPNPEESVVAFERLTKEFPNSPWTGDAHVRLIDVKLEQQFDLPGAEKHAQAAAKWLETVDKAALEKATRPLGDSSSSLATDHRPLTTAYAIYLRAGLIEYLNERCPKAVEWFEKAKPFAPERNLVVVHGHIPTGIEKLIDLAKSRKFITPEVVRKGDHKAKLILMLADVYHEGEQWQKSLDLCNRVIDGAAPKATREQKSYAFYRRARNYYSFGQKGYDPDSAFKDYAAAGRGGRSALFEQLGLPAVKQTSPAEPQV